MHTHACAHTHTHTTTHTHTRTHTHTTIKNQHVCASTFQTKLVKFKTKKNSFKTYVTEIIRSFVLNIHTKKAKNKKHVIFIDEAHGCKILCVFVQISHCSCGIILSCFHTAKKKSLRCSSSIIKLRPCKSY